MGGFPGEGGAGEGFAARADGDGGHVENAVLEDDHHKALKWMLERFGGEGRGGVTL